MSLLLLAPRLLATDADPAGGDGQGEAHRDTAVYQKTRARSDAVPAPWWTRFYVIGPVGGAALALTDAVVIALYMRPAWPFQALAVASMFWIGVTAIAAAYVANSMGARVGAAALASLVPAPLDAVFLTSLVAFLSGGHPAGCGCFGGGRLVGVEFFVVVVVPIIAILLRLGLSMTVGLLSAWLGANVY